MSMRSTVVVSTLFGLLALVACQRKPVMDSSTTEAWSKVIVGHTSGVVSRKSDVRVVFAADVAGKPPEAALLRIEPAIPGALEFRGPRELVLSPTTELKPGQVYKATLTPAGLAGVAAGLTPYEFSFRVQTPQFDVALGDLVSDPADDRRMQLSGTIVTADAEDATRIEKMLASRYRNAPLAVTWSHAGDGLEHRFQLAGIERQAAAEKVAVVVEGSARSDRSAAMRSKWQCRRSRSSASWPQRPPRKTAAARSA